MRMHLLIVLVIIPMLSARSFGCTCARHQPPSSLKNLRELVRWQLQESKILFEGRVERMEIQHGQITPVPDDALSATPSADELIVTFRILRSFRGGSSGAVRVITSLGQGSCGFDFENGRSYLVDAFYDASGAIFTSSCQQTRTLESAGPQLRALRNEPPTAEDLLVPSEYWKSADRLDGTLCGQISHTDGSPVGKTCAASVWRVLNSPVAPLQHGDVRVNRDGSYCTGPLEPGKYIIGAEDGDPWATGVRYTGYFSATHQASKAEQVEIKPKQVLRGIDFALFPQKVYTVSGLVVPPANFPFPITQMRVVIRSAENELLTQPEDTAIGSDGTFEFYQVPPGRYLVSVSQAGGAASMGWSQLPRAITVPEQAKGVVLSLASDKE